MGAISMEAGMWTHLAFAGMYVVYDAAGHAAYLCEILTHACRALQ